MNPYAAGWRLGFLRTIRSPGDMSVRIGFFAIILVVMSALWTAAIDANGGSLARLHPHVAALVRICRPDSGAGGAAAIGRGDRRRDRQRRRSPIQMLRPVSVVGLRMSIDIGEAVRTADRLVHGGRA